MLKSLFIQNYALIDTLDIEFGSGFSVITGETGAGKSILLGAIGLLLGQRADIKAIKKGENRCVIEAHFDLTSYDLSPLFEENDLDLEAHECIIRRELTSAGKSRAFINDIPTQLSVLKSIGEKLIDIHSQHQNLLLNQEEFQLNVLDIIAQSIKAKNDYQEVFLAYKKCAKAVDELKESIEMSRTNEEYLRFQLQQLEEAHLVEDEQEQLEEEANTLAHAEEIKRTLLQISSQLSNDEGGMVSQLKSNYQSLGDLTRIFPRVEELAQRLESCYIELKDITSEVENLEEHIDFDPARLEYIHDRLNVIYTLQKKHHVSSNGELIELAKTLTQQVNEIECGDEQLLAMQKELQQHLDLTIKKGEVLTQLRTKAALEVEKEMKNRLSQLGIPHVQFKVQLTPRKSIDMQGMDNVEFLFSANKNGTLENVAQVASGGEIARVMLSLKAMISGAVMLPTLIFDEIDTGVSGSIAEKMAHIMQEMGSTDRQVISITHLPQIAALGKRHYRVYKEDGAQHTTSHIEEITGPARVEEIAHMLCGAKLTEAAINNAKELLNIS